MILLLFLIHGGFRDRCNFYFLMKISALRLKNSFRRKNLNVLFIIPLFDVKLPQCCQIPCQQEKAKIVTSFNNFKPEIVKSVKFFKKEHFCFCFCAQRSRSKFSTVQLKKLAKEYFMLIQKQMKIISISFSYLLHWGDF